MVHFKAYSYWPNDGFFMHLRALDLGDMLEQDAL
jgi:hypothetical protein